MVDQLFLAASPRDRPVPSLAVQRQQGRLGRRPGVAMPVGPRDRPIELRVRSGGVDGGKVPAQPMPVTVTSRWSRATSRSVSGRMAVRRRTSRGSGGVAAEGRAAWWSPPRGSTVARRGAAEHRESPYVSRACRARWLATAVREATPSLVKMRDRWASTVLGLMNSWPAIWRLV